MTEHARAIAKLTASSGIATLCQIGKGKLAAVLLGTEGVGVLSQLKYLWNLLQFLCGLGFYNGLVRHVAEGDAANDQDKIRQHVSSVLVVVAAVSLLGTLISLAVSPFLSSFLFAGERDKVGYVFLILLCVPCAVVARMYKGILSAYRNVRAIVISQIVADITSVVLFAALTYPLGLYGAIAAFCLYHFVRMCLNLGLACRSHGIRQVLPHFGDMHRSAVKENASFGIAALIIMPTSILTTVFVSRWIIDCCGVDQNGIFAAAWTVSSVYLRVTYESASSYYLPVMSTARDVTDMTSHMDNALRLYLVGIPPIVIALSTMGEYIISLLFTRDFAASGELLIWLLPADLFRVVTETLGISMLARKVLMPYLLAYEAWCAAFLGLGYVAIREFGIHGACYAYFASHLLYMLLQAALVYRLFGYVPGTRAVWIITRGILLAIAASAMTLAWPTATGRTLAFFTCGATWLGLSLKEPEFYAIKQKILHRFGAL